MASLKELATKLEQLEQTVDKIRDAPEDATAVSLEINGEVYDLSMLEKQKLFNMVAGCLNDEIKYTKKEMAAML